MSSEILFDHHIKRADLIIFEKKPLKVKDVFLWSILRDKEREGGAGDTPFPIKAGNSGL